MPIRVLEDIIQPGATPSSGYADRYPKVDMPASVLEAQRANQKKVMPNILDKALAVASVPYNFAKGIIGNPSHPGAVTQVSLTQAQKERLNEIAQAKRTPTGTINYSDYGSPTKTFSGISDMNALEASLATTMGGTGYTTNPDGSINYTGGAYDFNKGNVITDFIDKGGIIGAADMFGKNIYNYIHGPQMKFKHQQLINKKKQKQADVFKKIKEKQLADEAAAKAKADAAAAAKEAAQKAATKKQAAQNKKNKTGGYQSSHGGNKGFMGGKGTAAEMGSFAQGGLIDFYRYGGFI